MTSIAHVQGHAVRFARPRVRQGASAMMMAEKTKKMASDNESDESAILISSGEEEVVPGQQSVAVFTPTKRPPLSSDTSEGSTDEEESFMRSGTACRKRIRFERSSDSTSESEDKPDVPIPCQYYDGDTELPVFSTTPFGYPAEKVARVLLNPEVGKVCHVQPLGVTKNVTFIVDIDDVAFTDLRADDLGAWKTNGTKTTHFRILPSGTIWIASTKRKGPRSSYYTMTRRYYVHGTYRLFRRVIIDIRDDKGRHHKYAMVQYLFDGPEVEVKIKPHGNSKQGRPYFRTSGSTQKRIKEIAATHTPKEAIDKLTMEQSGELHARGAASLPRGRHQISYAREQKRIKDPNPLHSVMLECKLAQGKSEIYVQDVKAAPQPMCVLSSEWQLDDMVRFLTNNRFGILTVDTTYNVGDFYVTPLTYPHLMLEDTKSGKSPLLLGPILVHQSVDFSAFNYFASTLIGCRRDLCQLMAFGSDGDKALVEAMTHNFPYSIQLRCFLHFRKNVEEKLEALALSSAVSREYLDDIFGKRVCNTFQEGLVDSSSVDEVEKRLGLLKPIWDARESAYAPASGPRFHTYFCRYQADGVRYHMRKDLREIAGLGSPPSQFTTNGSESVNAVIKRAVDYKELDWPQLNEHMKNLVSSQHEEVTRALSGRGQFRLKPEFSHYAVTTQKWMRMRPDQRQDIVDRFQKARIPARDIASIRATNTGRGKSSAIEETLEKQYSSDDELERAKNYTDREGLTCMKVQTGLCICAEDSGITTIPLVTLDGMWAKADKLLSSENAITPAPGKKSRMVVSYSQVVPHLVQSKSNGQYTCDDNCQQWLSSQILLSTIQTLPRSFSGIPTMLRVQNISTLAMSGLSRGRGRMGGETKASESEEECTTS